MTRYRKWGVVAAGLVLVAGVAASGAEESVKPAPPPNQLLWDDQNQTGVSVEEFRQMLQTIPEPQRYTYQDDIRLGGKLVRLIYQQKRMAVEADRLRLAEQPGVQARLTVAQRQILGGALLEHFQNGLEKPNFEALTREHYLTHRDQYRTPEQLSLAMIWLKTPCECERPAKQALAETVQAKLKAGESFETLAKQYSEDKATGDLGGRLPLRIGRGDADPPIEAAVFALDPPGAVSGIVETERGFYLYKLLERHPSVERDFDAVKAEIVEELKSKYLSVQVGDYAARFEASPTATLNEELLKKQALPQ
ncbi:MAG: peptidylprolyl isomerase [Candidatus Contendobacter sp.]|nr:peptidylprolyl isomerase [Candidatus Contendobacter sp.]